MVRSGASPCREELSFHLLVFLTFDQFTRVVLLGSKCIFVLTILTDTQGGWEGMSLDDLFCRILV